MTAQLHIVRQSMKVLQTFSETEPFLTDCGHPPSLDLHAISGQASVHALEKP